MESEKRFSAHTVDAYLSDLKQFSLFASDQYESTSLSTVTSAMVRSWIIDMMDQDISSRSVNRKLSTLKTYFRFLQREGDISVNPMSKVISPKNGSRLPVYLEKNDMEALVSDEMFAEGFSGVRDKLVILLFYYTGMRRGEMLGLNLRSVNLQKKTIKVLGKGNKERLIPLNDEMEKSIIDYIEARAQICDPSENTLIVTDKGRPAYPNFIYRLVKSYMARVSTIQKKSPHILRHTFATHMLNNGADLNSIKEILGHANLSATQVYTHNSIDKLKQIYEQAHPKA